MKITFNYDGRTYESNDAQTYFYSYPIGLKGERVRIRKAEFESARKDMNEESREAKIDQAWEEAVTKVEETETTEEVKEIAKEMTVKLQPVELNEHGVVDCRNCPCKDTCIHRDAMRRNPESVGGLGLCPRLKVKTEEPKQPKVKKARKSKDTAFATTIGDTHITLTSKQTDFIRHLSDTCFWENGLNSVIWVDCLCDDIQGQFEGKPMTVGAMISTLCEKGLGTRTTERRDGRKCTSFALTELGKKIAAEVGLE